jgi:uncharacterized protein YggE
MGERLSILASASLENAMKILVRAAFAAALLASAAAPAVAQVPSVAAAPLSGTALTLSAFGEVKTAPDMAAISLGVLTQGPTAEDASRANAERMNAVMTALRRAGVAERDIQTSGLNLSPQYVYDQGQPPRLNGYQARNQVTVKVTDLAHLGATLDGAVAAGANEVQGIAFGLKNPTAAEDEARRRAVAALQAKAGVYAQATGMRIVRMISLSEGGGYQAPPPRPIPMVAGVARMKAEDTSISPGETTVRIDVEATYELGR